MISFNCPGCQAPYSVSDAKAGKSGKCPKCRTPFVVPTPIAEGVKATPRAVDEDDEVQDERPTERVVNDDDRPQEMPADRRRPRPPVRRRPTDTRLDGALGSVRLSQYLDAAATVTLLLAVTTLYFGIVHAANGRVAQMVAARDQALKQYEQQMEVWQRQWMRNADGRMPARPVPPPELFRDPPTPREAMVRLAEDRWALVFLPLVPALLLLTSGVLAAVGRFRLAWAAAGSGGSRVFLGVAFFAVGRALLGLAAFLLLAWVVVESDELRSGNGNAALILRGLLAAFAFSLYCGVIGEVMALPGLALAGWHERTTAVQRHRIGTAAAFYPLLLLFLFFVAVVSGLLAYLDFDIPAAVYGGVWLAVQVAVQVLQLIVVLRAYRFPPAADAVN